METAIEEPQSEKKRIVERSAAYPVIGLEEAIPFVATVYKNFPGSIAVSRDDIAAILKTKAYNIHRDIAATVHYGLLSRDKDKYRVTELFKTLANPLSEVEKKKCLLQAFFAPKLYQELITRHDGHVIPPELRTHLIRFHKIAEKAAPSVADGFLENAKFVGAVNEHGILGFKQALEKLDGNPPKDEQPPVGNASDSQTNYEKPPVEKPQQETPPPSTPPRLLEEMVNSDKIRVRLTGGKFAFIVHPLDINKTDVAILHKEIEKLQLIVDSA